MRTTWLIGCEHHWRRCWVWNGIGLYQVPWGLPDGFLERNWRYANANRQGPMRD